MSYRTEALEANANEKIIFPRNFTTKIPNLATIARPHTFITFQAKLHEIQ